MPDLPKESFPNSPKKNNLKNFYKILSFSVNLKLKELFMGKLAISWERHEQAKLRFMHYSSFVFMY